MKINIAVCDDEKEICDYFKKELTEIFLSKNIDFNINIFLNGEDLCDEMLNTNYDLIFLDIELPMKNGIETGKFIRENLYNEYVQIAYISSKKTYAMELFESHPLNFLIKPISHDKLLQLIEKFLLISNIDNKTFKFKAGHQYKKIALSEILYFTSSGRKVIIITLSDTFEYYDTLDNVYSIIKDDRFLYIHKSFIVNYRFIKNYSYDNITMSNNQILSISQSRRKSVRKKYLEITSEEL